jgi:hypothetical protein
VRPLATSLKSLLFVAGRSEDRISDDTYASEQKRLLALVLRFSNKNPLNTPVLHVQFQ